MAGKALEINEIIDGKDDFAEAISNHFEEWNTHRMKFLEEKRELRNYIFATSTRDTSNASLPWKNSTTSPKLTQIRDNLHANYMSALFPNDNWLNWEAEDRDSADGEKRRIMESYMRNKTRGSTFRSVMSQLVYDFIDWGNCFATVDYFDESMEGEDGEIIPGYVGPKVVRISPNDIVFNPVAADFDSSPKIVRSVKTLGELKVELEENPEKGYLADVFNLVVENRTRVKSISQNDINKNDAYQVDGFSSIYHYYDSGYVELLEFIGDIYHDGQLYKDHIITVVDRKHIIRKIPNPTWRKSLIRHVGWRLRPDNLYAMGPLDNLVGLQYRIDHLENLKADVFDFIAHPVMKVRGYVEDFEYGPNERVYVGDDGDVEFIRPDATALNADNQIAELAMRMEEMAGAPKQAMGIRTPGEKTAFEVQTLDNASGRIFQNKVTYFEQMFVEPILNDMLEVTRRNMNSKDVVSSIDNDLGVKVFTDITPDDLNGKGRLFPIGARHFAAKANLMQNLTNLSNSAIGQDPSVNIHLSGKKIAKLIEEIMDLEKYGIYEENIRVAEQQQTQQMINSAQREVDETAAFEGDVAVGDSLDIPPEGEGEGEL